MHTLTIPGVSEDLQRRLEYRAQVNHRTVADEARCCLESVLAEEAGLLEAIPAAAWQAIEDSVAATLHDQGTPLTDEDFHRFREMARGRSRS